MAKPNQSETCLTGLLEIPIGTSRTGPMKRLVADMHDVAAQLDRARNAMVRAWLRWREDHPDWKPPIVLKEDGTPKLRKNGEPWTVNPMHPVRLTHDGAIPQGDDEHIGFDTWLYHVGRTAAPEVATCLISTISKEVVSNLTTDVQHHHNGHKFRWQAILANDEQAPTFRARTIPVPNNSASLCYEGKVTSKNKLLEFWGKSSCAALLPLFSGSSGREVRSPIATLNVGRLSPGNRQVVKKIARGEFKFSDSKLVFKNERWQLQLTYKQPSSSLELDPERVAVIIPRFDDASQPFTLSSEEAHKTWQCGHGKILEAALQRLDDRRKGIRNKYRHALSGVKGHGRKRFEMRVKPWARATQNLQRHFIWGLINEVVRFCKAFNCGKVVYREPTLGIREHLWLGKKGVPFDWTSLSTDLAYKMKYYGIEFVLERINGKEIRERFGGEKHGKNGNSSETQNGNRHAENGKKPSRFDCAAKKEPLANGNGKH